MQIYGIFHGSWIHLFNWINCTSIAIMMVLLKITGQLRILSPPIDDLWMTPLMYQSFCFQLQHVWIVIDDDLSSMPIGMWLHRWLFLHKQQKLQECLPRSVEPAARREVDTFPIPSGSSLLCCFRFFPFLPKKQKERLIHIWSHQSQSHFF